MLGADGLSLLRQERDRIDDNLAKATDSQRPFVRRPLSDPLEIQRFVEAQLGSAPPAPEMPDCPSLVGSDPELGGDYLTDSVTLGLIPVVMGDGNPLDATRSAERATIHARLDGLGLDYRLGSLVLRAVRQHVNRSMDVSVPLELWALDRARTQTHYSPQAFLTDLGRAATPLLAWDALDVAPGLPIRLDILSVEDIETASDLVNAAYDQKLMVVTALDPYAITRLQLRFGLPWKALTHVAGYAEAANDLMKLTVDLSLSDDLLFDDAYIPESLFGVGAPGPVGPTGAQGERT